MVVPFHMGGVMSAKAEESGGDISLEQELSRTIREAAPAVVRKVLEKAKEGSYLHAKFLFELAGVDLKRADAGEESASEESLAAYLLKELRETPRVDTESQREG